MGMTMGEIFNLQELGEDCAADKVYEFLFVAPAIPITGAVGSPVNPLAIKWTPASPDLVCQAPAQAGHLE